ncbi:MAG: DUF3093 domain-containing protein [Bowdeniella nasicola]|nr:DUF3093 domain-containing protein [Bowdeniella nasicola]
MKTKTMHQHELPPVLYIALAAALGGSFGLIFVPIGNGAAIIVAVVGALAAAGIMIATAPRIEVSESELRVGNAHIPLRFLRHPQVINREQLRDLLGVNADERAWVVHRPWAKSAVRIELDDPRDPTPYWLVCTKDPHRLVRVLHEQGVPR